MPKHPYSSYEHHPAWAVMRKALAELEQNGDLDVSTPEAYVVGFLLKALAEAGQLGPTNKPPVSRPNPFSISVVKRRPGKSASVQQIANTSTPAQHLSEDPASYGNSLSKVKKVRASKKLNEASRP
jgi:hypothetical protein